MNDHATPGEPIRILLADDDREFNDLISRFLAIAGYEVQAAYDGLQAIEAARSFRPHVAILDISMPGMDGYTAARTMRADPQLGNIRLVALSASTYDEHQQRCQDAGFDKQLVKPCGLATLYALVSSLAAADEASAWRDAPFYVAEDTACSMTAAIAELARRFYAEEGPKPCQSSHGR